MQRITRMRGDDWGIAVNVEGVDISTATFKAQSRVHFDASVAHEWACVIDLSGTPPTRVDCSLPAAITKDISSRAVVWDLEMILDGTVQTLTQLEILVGKDVTRE